MRTTSALPFRRRIYPKRSSWPSASSAASTARFRTKGCHPLLDEIDTAARDLHSVNTVRFADGKATGFNTDILGFAESLNRDGVSLRVKRVLLLGYGGAASVMAYHCVTQGAYLTITGRNLEKAEALQKQLTDAVPGARISVFEPPASQFRRDIHIVLNSTPVGMYPKETRLRCIICRTRPSMCSMRSTIRR